MAGSIGSLYIDITARTATLEKDMARVKAEMDGVGRSVHRAGVEAKSAFESFRLFNSFQGRGMTGITLDMASFMLAVQAVKQEIAYVIQNIEKIPGIPAEAVQTINEFKVNLKEARNFIDGIVAVGLTKIFQFGTAVGTSLAEAIYGDQGALDTKLDSLDKIKAASDPAYWDKVTAAQLKLSEARKQEAVAAMTISDRIAELRKQSELYTTHSKSASIDTLTRLGDEANAYKRLTDADHAHFELKKRYDDAARHYRTEDAKAAFTEMSQKDKILELERLIGEEIAQTGVMRASVVGANGKANVLGDLTDAEMEKAIKIFPRLAGHIGELRTEMKKLKDASMEMRDGFVSVFSQADKLLTSLVTGGKFKVADFLKQMSDMIIETFFRLAVVNPILNGLFGSTKGFALLPSLFGSGVPAKADGGPGRGLTLVGERGPELLNLGSGTTIIPNHRITGGGGGNIYQIDARGADEARIQNLEQTLRMLNATVERRSIGASLTAKVRRQIPNV